MKQPHRIETISQFHKLRNRSQPSHPLISVVDVSGTRQLQDDEPKSLVFDFYTIAFKSVHNGKMKYGQQLFDFDSGMMGFSSPGQVISVEVEKEKTVEQSGWMILIHPDFLWHTALAKKIKQYGFFDYAVDEALFVSETEQTILNGIIRNIKQESERSIDKFTQEIIIAELEVLLAYADRFYQRQFITRKMANHQILDKLNDLLNDCFNDEAMRRDGLPKVAFIAAQLNVSPHYLSGLLRSLTGLNTQQHIHMKLVEKAKELLSTTSLSVSEIAYTLGFEQIQSFSKLFKIKTNLSPLAFRQSFN
jgi:AraC family transcriptional regulator, transcriptional activator of pobA